MPSSFDNSSRYLGSTQSMSAQELAALADRGNSFTPLEPPHTICLSKDGHPLSSEEVVIREKIYSVSISKNDEGNFRVSVTRGGAPLSLFHLSKQKSDTPDPPELLTVELELSNEKEARDCYLTLCKCQSNPIIALESIIELKKSGLYSAMRYPSGNIPFHLSAEIELPKSASSIAQPSLRKDPLTGLKLRPGFIRLFDEYYPLSCDVITVGEIDVANLGITNEVCGREFGDEFFLEVANIAQKHNRIKLFRHGGDEFSFAVFGYSEESNKAVIEAFLADIEIIREELISSLDETKRQELEEGCVAKAQKKGRAHVAKPLGLYVGVVSISSEQYQAFCLQHQKQEEQKGIVVQSLLGQAEKAVYNAKVVSNTEVVSVPIEDNLQLRSSDFTFISSLRGIDRLHKLAVDAIRNNNGTLSRAEKIILYRIISLIGATDVSVNNWITRSERFEEAWALIGQNQIKSSSVYIDFPAGILNDRIGPERTDEFFKAILSHLPIDYPVVTIRESGGGFKLIFPVNKITDKELGELENHLRRRISFHLDAIVENINYGILNRKNPLPNENLVEKIPVKLLYVGRTPRQALSPTP